MTHGEQLELRVIREATKEVAKALGFTKTREAERHLHTAMMSMLMAMDAYRVAAGE